ncbi:MAG: hypothetical protein ACRC34_05985, partial [Cetobacterium sp.]
SCVDLREVESSYVISNFKEEKCHSDIIEQVATIDINQNKPSEDILSKEIENSDIIEQVSTIDINQNTPSEDINQNNLSREIGHSDIITPAASIDINQNNLSEIILSKEITHLEIITPVATIESLNQINDNTPVKTNELILDLAEDKQSVVNIKTSDLPIESNVNNILALDLKEDVKYKPEHSNSHLIKTTDTQNQPDILIVDHLVLPVSETKTQLIDQLNVEITIPGYEAKEDALNTTDAPSNDLNINNFDTLVTDDKFAELIPSNNFQPQIIYNSPTIKSVSIENETQNEVFIDVYNCEEPLAAESDKSIRSIKEKLSKISKFAQYPGWDIFSFIVKSGGVLKHEYLAYQALTQMKEIFIMERL